MKEGFVFEGRQQWGVDNESWPLDYAHVLTDLDSWNFSLKARIERERPYTWSRLLCLKNMLCDVWRRSKWSPCNHHVPLLSSYQGMEHSFLQHAKFILSIGFPCWKLNPATLSWTGGRVHGMPTTKIERRFWSDQISRRRWLRLLELRDSQVAWEVATEGEVGTCFREWNMCVLYHHCHMCIVSWDMSNPSQTLPNPWGIFFEHWDSFPLYWAICSA